MSIGYMLYLKIEQEEEVAKTGGPWGIGWGVVAGLAEEVMYDRAAKETRGGWSILTSGMSKRGWLMANS